MEDLKRLARSAAISPLNNPPRPALLALSVIIALAVLLSINGSAAAQTTVDYDEDNDGYIDVDTHAQLNAIRYDLNGDGAQGTVSASDWANYGAAFPGAVSGMGRDGTCTGYKLHAFLDLDSDGDGDVDANDHGGAYWDRARVGRPSGADDPSTSQYPVDFKGNGFTIAHMFINRYSAS